MPNLQDGQQRRALDVEERWTQTLDLPRKKKGTQSEALAQGYRETQANNIDIFEATH